jgi:predicted membrane protein
MKRGGSLDNSTSFMIGVTILNLIAYMSVKDWKASAILVFAGIATFAFANKGLVLFVGILAAALFRSVLIEGLENKDTKDKDKDKAKEEKKVKIPENPTDIIEGDATSIKGATLEGLSQQAGELEKKQKNLIDIAKDLQPMMKQAENMLNKLPEGFLAQAMKNFNNKA